MYVIRFMPVSVFLPLPFIFPSVFAYTLHFLQKSLLWQSAVNITSLRIVCMFEYLPGLLAGPSGICVGWGIKQWQIRGQKAPSFGWATFGWASCNLCPLCIALDLVV